MESGYHGTYGPVHESKLLAPSSLSEHSILHSKIDPTSLQSSTNPSLAKHLVVRSSTLTVKLTLEVNFGSAHSVYNETHSLLITRTSRLRTYPPNYSRGIRRSNTPCRDPLKFLPSSCSSSILVWTTTISKLSRIQSSFHYPSYLLMLSSV